MIEWPDPAEPRHSLRAAAIDPKATLAAGSFTESHSGTSEGSDIIVT